VQSSETGSRSSLLDMRTVSPENGPSLPLAGYLRWAEELQGFSAIPDIHIYILLGVLCSDGDLVME